MGSIFSSSSAAPPSSVVLQSTEFIDSVLPVGDDEGQVGIFANRETAERVSHHLRHYAGNRVSSVVLALHRVPQLSLIVENVAYFLRNHNFPLVHKPVLWVSNTGIPRKELVPVLDQLVEALCDNIHVHHLQIMIPTPPSQRLIHRLFQEKSSPSPGSVLRVDGSELQVYDVDEDYVALGATVFSLASEQQVERSFTVQCSYTGVETVLGALMACPEGATQLQVLLHPQSVRELKNALPTLGVIFPRLFFITAPGLVDMVEGAEIYAGISRSRAVKRVIFRDFTFEGHAVPVATVDPEAPCMEVTLMGCTVGRQAVNVFLSRPIDTFVLSGRGPSPPTNLVDDFLEDLCRGQPSLFELRLEKIELSIDEMRSLCDLMSRAGCRISYLGIGGKDSDRAWVLTGDCIAIFFQNLPEMRSLKGLRVEYAVTTLQLANAVLAGVRNNVFLKHLFGLRIEVAGLKGRTEEIAFWLRCNARGHYLVAGHLQHPVSIPLAFFAEVFHLCSSSGDHQVLFHFLRRLVPSLQNGLDSRRSRRRERQGEALA